MLIFRIDLSMVEYINILYIFYLIKRNIDWTKKEFSMFKKMFHHSNDNFVMKKKTMLIYVWKKKAETSERQKGHVEFGTINKLYLAIGEFDSKFQNRTLPVSRTMIHVMANQR